MNLKYSFVPFFAAVLFLSACSGAQEKTAVTSGLNSVGTSDSKVVASAPAARPDWVKNCYTDKSVADKVNVRCAFGSMDYSPNGSLQEDGARNRARTNLADEIRVFVKKLVVDYRDQHKDYFNPDSAGSDEFISIVSRSVTTLSLDGARVTENWQDPETKRLYMLAVIDLESSFVDAYKKKMREEALRHEIFVKSKADLALQDMDKEIDKQMAADRLTEIQTKAARN